MNEQSKKSKSDIDDCLSYFREVALYRPRWVSTEVWYRPWTWGRGYYEKVGGAK